jgi:hypothetical protein
MLPKHAAQSGMFLMEGLLEVNQETLNKAWGQGFLELVMELSEYAQDVWNLAEVGGAITGEFPGVYDYEVTTPLGKRFAEWVVEHEDAPTREKFLEWAIEYAYEFFMQGSSERVNDGLKAALTLAVSKQRKQAEEVHVGWTILNRETGRPSSYLFAAERHAQMAHEESLRSPYPSNRYGKPIKVYVKGQERG